MTLINSRLISRLVNLRNVQLGTLLIHQLTNSPTHQLPSLLPQHRFHPRQISSDRPNLLGRFELPHRFLNAHPEQLVREVALLRTELVGAEVAQLRRLHSIFSCAKRVANFVRIGSFDAARVNASRASFSDTPSISKSTRPGLMTATHCSGAPLPL